MEDALPCILCCLLCAISGKVLQPVEYLAELFSRFQALPRILLRSAN
jgi:hypothetical protein